MNYRGYGSGITDSYPWSYAILAEILAVLIGLLAGVLPEYRAARMDPVEALRTE